MAAPKSVIPFLSTFLYFFLLLFVQATERMKIVDVLGAKQFSDGERIITQVRHVAGEVAYIHNSYIAMFWIFNKL